MRFVIAILQIAAVMGVTVFGQMLFRFLRDLSLAKRTAQKPKLSSYINLHSKSDVGCFLFCLSGIIYLIAVLISLR